ncbi:carbohydrate-binding protein [Flavobacterium sp. MFBS3-15]|uniref:carbohydrate-binding protein n=1 Tax=Flavobacterium sp. MFBS3-15 TaxID=2989816 RepID=UPI002236842D|nr:carbohydrate-binding protein [Flavobacterium sp. MFBS3-15]MCW4468091.1 carbohydrate-binding protein [Flavobacterium sp. MFBS3-15]
MKQLYKILLLVLSFSAFGQGYLHQNGQNIVDGNGNNVLLRGMGLGGWMVQEGYMLQTDAFAGTQWQIREKITQLIGEANAETFYQAYRNNGITKRDIDSLKAWGFNSVRLPMHYNLYTLPIEQEPVAGQNTWLEEGFQRTDQLLEWCEQNQIYLILDMHAAPGGQGKDANISDYNPAKPSLWESEANKQKLIALWAKLAERYKNEPWIGGYDLINEPNWAFTGSNQNGCDENSNAPLRTLYVAITNAIRAVDTNHIIIIEGNCWGNNYNGMFPLWDTNMTLSFHKYWNANTVGAIQGILNLRTQHNVPLWLGESGENSNVWFRDAISLVESLNIGWAWWPLKKIGSIAGPAAVTKTAQYQQLLDYWSNGGTQPSQEFAFNALMQIAENYKMQNVTTKPDVIDAMFRQIQTTETVKYKTHNLPGKVYATEYDLGPHLYAYHDTDIANYRTDTGTFTAWNNGWAMRNDGVDIQESNDTGNGFHVSHIVGGEWLLYTLTQQNQTAYDIDIRYSGMGGAIHLEDANGRISERINLPSTGSYTTWSTVTLTDVLLQAGENKVKVYFDAGSFNLNFVEFKNPTTSAQADFKVIDAATNVLGDKINVVFNKHLQSGIDLASSGLTLKVNGNAVTISSIVMGTVANSFVIIPATAINPSDVVTFTYAGSNLIAVDTTVHAAFTDKPVSNRIGNLQQISGVIQAESFYANSGLELENTTDAGGGQNIGYTDAGDYLEYLVNISQAGNYRIEYRRSGESQTGGLKLQLINENTQDIHTVTMTPTGGWQNWQTLATDATLPAGRYFLRLVVTAPGFNLNWVKFSFQAPDSDNDGVPDTIDQCPGTPAGTVVDFNGCTLFTLPSNNFALQVTSETCRTSNNGSIAITAAANHNYVATLTGTANQTANFTTTTSFSNLAAGEYKVCITLPEAPAFSQCFDVVVTEPGDLSVLQRVAADNYTVNLELEGGSHYTINLNGMVYETSANSITLDLKGGENNLEIKTDKECQGVYRKTIMMDNSLRVYPNPVSGNDLHVLIPEVKNGIIYAELFSTLGKRVIAGNYTTQDKVFTVDTGSLAAGIYVMKVVAGMQAYNIKIVKE